MRRKSGKSKQQQQPRRCYRPRKPKNPDSQEVPEEGHVSAGGKRFFGCYLLTSLCPRYKGHSYIGFTVNPKRRIRQHNGEINSGAYRTKKKRPWEMVLCIHGFPSNVVALQFEWAWQHPRESIAVREVAASFKTLGGLGNKIKLALTMLTLPSWNSMDLTVSFFSTKYMTHVAGCPKLPPQMKLHFCSMDELPDYSLPGYPGAYQDEDGDDTCSESNDKPPDLIEHSQEESTLEGFTETEPHPSYTQNDALPNVSEDISTWHQRFVGCPLEIEASSEVGDVMPEEPGQQPSHQILVNDHGSKDEISWVDQVNDVDSPRWGILSDNNFPILRKHSEQSHQLPADLHSFNQGLKGHMTLGNKVWLEDEIEPFQQVDTHVREQSLMVDCISSTEKVRNIEDFTCILIEDSPKGESEPAKVYSTKYSAASIHPSATDEIEVIDLFTPPPDSRIMAASKKRRVSDDCPNIIDLTRSPHFLEL